MVAMSANWNSMNGKDCKNKSTVCKQIAIVYVVFAKHYHPVEVSQQLNRFGTPIIYDSLGIMDKQNNLSFNPRYKTFLLDSMNHVIGIGNPVTNKQVWEWYKIKIGDIRKKETITQ